MKRRSMLVLGSATMVGSLLRAGALARETPADTKVSLAAGEPLRKPWWGISTNGGEWWSDIGATTREEALAIARADYFGEVRVALCRPRNASMPDMLDVVIEWLAGTGYHDLRGALCDAFEGSNADVDFEGEVGEVCCDLDWQELEQRLMPHIVQAFERYGIFVEKITGGCIEDAEDALGALETDPELERVLEAEVEAWSDWGAFQCSPRSLDLIEEETLHNGEEPSA